MPALVPALPGRGGLIDRRDAVRQRGQAASWTSWPVVAAFLVAAGGLCALVEGPLWKSETALAALNLACSLVFVFTGMMLRKEPGQRAVSWALVLGGLLRSADFIDAWNGAWPSFAVIFGAVDRLFGAYALLRYPNYRLLRYQRVYLISLTAWMLVGRTLIVITSTAQWNADPASTWWPALFPDLRLTEVVNYVVSGGEGVFGAGLLVLLVMRLRRTKGLDRIVITPIVLAGIAAVIAASASALNQMVVSPSTTINGAYLMESAVDLAVPVAFLVAVIQRALLVRNLSALATQISAGADMSAVRYALQATLHDPTLDIVDLSATGEATREVAVRPPDRLVEVVRTEAGTPIAVIIADPALERYRGLFDAAVQTSGLALKHAQLREQAAREKLEQVRASRARIIEAGLAERQRIERDLHDGVQQHVLGVAARLTAAMTRTSDPEATAAFGEARDGLKEILAELRDLAHGIHPAVLTQAGLTAALEEVVERLPLPVRVTGPPARASTARASAAAEAVGYFVACEALTNVVKHAKADSAAVTIRIHGGHLDIEIADDGIGGASRSGHGIANIMDRVSALDGEFAIDSPPGGGTRLVVRLPCG